MYSDTHFHFSMVQERTSSACTDIILRMIQQNCFFAMDIGTTCDDLSFRKEAIACAFSGLLPELSASAERMIHYSAGIWPDTEAIRDRIRQVCILEQQISKYVDITAVGECGLDHHWNPSGEDGRCADDFDSDMYAAEKELFEMQLKLARKLDLPVIVHSRDAFTDTFEVIKRTGYDNGIIHCFSYGVEEAEHFIERGWYISFSGSVTYTKRSKMDDMRSLIRYIPEDRILCETDAPYLAPVPVRGQPNTPLFVEHTYKFIADIRGIPVEQLCDTVDSNCRALFNLK
jgi:TatD DNase family protein